MKKLITKKITNLVNYQQFLKHNYLKINQFKLKNVLFENKILYNNLNVESYVVEFNSYKNIYLPFTLIKIDEIATIALKYENIYLFNYNLTYNILNQFNKIMFQIVSKKNNNIIKGRLLGGNWNNKKIFISILGFIFSMKPINLNNSLNFKKKNYFKKSKNFFFLKNKINATKLINCYKLKYVNFTIHNFNKNISKKKELSRILYIRNILKNKKIQKKLRKNITYKKSVLSRKIYVEK